jgi:hypothetical protein
MTPASDSNSGPILEKLMAFFEQDDWEFERDEEDTILRLSYEGENGTWPCIAQAIQERERFVFYSILPKFVPALMRLEAGEYIGRANFGMEIGNFEMDFDDGEVRFRTSVDIEGGVLTEVMIRNLAYTNIAVMDQYLPGLRQVVNDGIEPAKAIVAVEEE